MTPPRTVLVTGASSGIGAATARVLAERGWRVFAGVRRPDRAPAAPGIEPLVLDVSDRASIAKAGTELAARLGDHGLNALVNNAGIGQVAPVEAVPLDDFERVFAVNVFGLVAVTQAALPLLRRARGRIVNLSSVGGLLTIPFGGALCASKHAVEAITDALRLELRPDGIAVIAVRPAAVASPAANKLAAETDRTLAALPEDARARYETSLREFIRHMQEDENAGSPPAEVARVIADALEAAHPATHYLAGKHAGLLAFLARWVPDGVRDGLLLRRLGLPTG